MKKWSDDEYIQEMNHISPFLGIREPGFNWRKFYQALIYWHFVMVVGPSLQLISDWGNHIKMRGKEESHEKQLWLEEHSKGKIIWCTLIHIYFWTVGILNFFVLKDFFFEK